MRPDETPHPYGWGISFFGLCPTRFAAPCSHPHPHGLGNSRGIRVRIRPLGRRGIRRRKINGTPQTPGVCKACCRYGMEEQTNAYAARAVRDWAKKDWRSLSRSVGITGIPGTPVEEPCPSCLASVNGPNFPPAIILSVCSKSA